MSYQGKHVWIIGASSGIGYALAKELSQRGAILSLSARSESKLEDLRQKIGLQHHVFPLDVTDIDAFVSTAQKISYTSQVDSVVYLAAAYQPMALIDLDVKMTETIIATNVSGAFYFINAIASMIKSSSIKQIVLCGSVAGFCGLPNGQPYSATKAAVMNLAQSLRAELPKEIDVKLISPGFVKTTLTDKNTFEMPMIITPERAAIEIADGLLSNKFEIHFPKKFTWVIKLIAIVPYWLYFRIVKKIK